MSTETGLPRHLFNAPKAEQVTVIFSALVGLYRASFPDRIRAAYLIGSQSDGSAASVSDIDGCILFKDSFQNEAEAELAETIMSHCRRISPLRLDVIAIAEDNERLKVDVRLKLGGRLVWGEDIRGSLPLPTMAVYQADMQSWAYNFLAKLHDVDEVVYPLVYPEPNDYFFGYTKKRAELWYPPEIRAGTKEFVATICWVATSRLAFEIERFVGSRTECISLCQEFLGADGSFVATAYQKCKQKWDYKIPEADQARQELRELCRQALGFFNRYLQEYNRSTEGLMQ